MSENIRRYASGAQKRKLMNKRSEEVQKQKFSITAFLNKSKGNTGEERNEEELETTDELHESGEEQRKEEENNYEETNCEENEENFQQIQSEIPSSKFPKNRFSSDIALWPKFISDNMIDYFINNVPTHTGNINNLKIQYSDRNRIYFRSLSEANFYCTKANGTKELRQWLLYSETSKCVYCYI